LEVLEAIQDGPVRDGQHPLDHLEGKPTTSGQVRRRRGIEQLQHVSTHVSQVRRQGRRASDIADGCGRDVLILGDDVAPGFSELALTGLATDRRQEPALADARHPADEQELSAAYLDVVEAAIDQLEDPIATDEQGAADRTDGHVHGR
jgi:hypothetical protein